MSGDSYEDIALSPLPCPYSRAGDRAVPWVGFPCGQRCGGKYVNVFVRQNPVLFRDEVKVRYALGYRVAGSRRQHIDSVRDEVIRSISDVLFCQLTGVAG